MADDNKIIAELEVRGKEAFIQSLQQGKAASDTLTTSVKEAGVVGSQSLEKLGNEAKTTATEFQKAEKSTASYKTQLKQMQAEIIGLTMDLGKMRAAGKEGTDEFNKLQQKIKQLTDDAGELKDVIGDVSDTVKNAGSDTRGIDNALRGINAMASGFQVVEGATALFGVENEKLQETLVRLNGIMAVTNGLQQLQDEALKNDSVFTLAATKAKAAYTLVVGQGTGAMKLFRLALASTGIGLFVIAIGLLVAKFDDVKKYLTSIFPQLGGLGKRFDEVKQQIQVFMKDGVLNVLNGFIRIYNSSLLVRGVFSAIGAAVVSVKDILVNNFKIIGTVFGSLFEAIQTRSFAPIKQGFKDIAALALDTGKQIVENIKGISTDGQLSLLVAKDIVSDAEAKKTGEKTATAIKTEVEKTPVQITVEAQVMDMFKFLDSQIESTKQQLAELYSGDVAAGLNAADNPQIKYLIAELKRLEQEIEQRRADFDSLVNGARATGRAVLEGAGGEQAKPLTLFERIFGTEDDNRTKQERMVEGARKITQELVAFGEELADVSSKAMSVRTQREIQELQNKRDKGLITQKEYDKKEAQIKNEAARKQRIVDIAMATAKIPLLVLNALVSAPFPANVILASLAGALGLAQVAILAATPLPKFKTGGSVAKKLGLIRGRSHEQGGVPIEVEGNEFVMNKRAVAKYGVGFMEKINDMKFNPIVNADKRLKSKSDSEYKLNESLATISTYLKQGYKVDAYGNKILEQIRDNLNTRNQYV